jgi:hypothetical protein
MTGRNLVAVHVAKSARARGRCCLGDADLDAQGFAVIEAKPTPALR